MTGEDLIRWREDVGLTRDDLARLLKSTYATVFRWEKNQRSIPPFLFLALKQIESELANPATPPEPAS